MRFAPVPCLAPARVAALLAFVTLGCGRSPLELSPLFDELKLEEEDPVAQGCRKVDYLFVIDNSASMGDNQARLIESFDGFIDGVQRSQDTLDSIHVGVVTTDVYAGHDDPACQSYGGLITTTAGHNSSDAECGPYAEGHNYMTERDDLTETFTCAAQVGTTGSINEAPLEALVSAADEWAGQGECNEGFIRDDALLVAVIITDEDDPGPVDYRYRRLVEAKAGRSDNIVMVGLINEPGTECSLSGHAREAPELASFISMFPHNFIAPVCGDYSAAFSRAISVVEDACWDASAGG